MPYAIPIYPLVFSVAQPGNLGATMMICSSNSTIAQANRLEQHLTLCYFTGVLYVQYHSYPPTSFRKATTTDLPQLICWFQLLGCQIWICMDADACQRPQRAFSLATHALHFSNSTQLVLTCKVNVWTIGSYSTLAHPMLNATARLSADGQIGLYSMEGASDQSLQL